MTNQVKSKTVSEMRREQKLEKLRTKQQRAAKKQTSKPITGYKPLQKNIADALADGLPVTDNQMERIRQRVTAQRLKPEDMPLEDYFVREVAALDETLSEIHSTIFKMGDLRTDLKWDLLKGNFPATEAEAFEAKLVDLETRNEAFKEEIVACITEAVENLEGVKVEPSVAKLDAYTIKYSTEAFQIFARWNETVIDRFHVVNDEIENMSTGEETNEQ